MAQNLDVKIRTRDEELRSKITYSQTANKTNFVLNSKRSLLTFLNLIHHGEKRGP